MQLERTDPCGVPHHGCVVKALGSIVEDCFFLFPLSSTHGCILASSFSMFPVFLAWKPATFRRVALAQEAMRGSFFLRPSFFIDSDVFTKNST